MAPHSLVDAILDALAADPILSSETGHGDGDDRFFEGRDTRRGARSPLPVFVLTNPASRYGDFNAGRKYTDTRWYDLHVLDEDSARAGRLAHRAVEVLMLATEQGRLDTEEGRVLSFLPGSHRGMLDQRPDGAGGTVGVWDQSVQLRIMLGKKRPA